MPCQISIVRNVVDIANSSFAFSIASLSLSHSKTSEKGLTVSLEVKSVVTGCHSSPDELHHRNSTFRAVDVVSAPAPRLPAQSPVTLALVPTTIFLVGSGGPIWRSLSAFDMSAERFHQIPSLSCRHIRESRSPPRSALSVNARAPVAAGQDAGWSEGGKRGRRLLDRSGCPARRRCLGHLA